MTRIITVTSGKGGVGKTSIGVNLSIQLAQRGQRVCLLDAGGGSANVAVVLGLKAQYTLRDLAVSPVGFDDVLVRHDQGFDVLVGSSGAQWVTALTSQQLARMATALSGTELYDFVVIDTPCGLERQLLSFSLASPQVLVVVTPEPASLTDAYTLVKLLHSKQYGGRIGVVVNRSKSYAVGRHSYEKFREVTSFHLGIQLPLLGLVREDDRLQDAVANEQPAAARYPGSLVARDVGGLADQLLSDKRAALELDIRTFWQRYLEAAGVAGTPAARRETETETKGDLHQQIEYLSAQVDRLIGEIARLRAGESRETRMAGRTASGGVAPELDTETWVRQMASGSESASVQGETFPIYCFEKANGDVLRFAYHSRGTDRQAPGTRTTSS